MAFAFKQIEAHDPSNPGLVAPNASVTIFEPGDPAMTPLTLTTLTGEPLPNPVTVNGLGYGPAFMHATLPQVAWAGGGLTGTFESYEGMRDEAIAARTAAENAAATAGADAAAIADAAIGTATDEATAAAAAATAAADAADASALAAANSAALVGAPADNAIATAINASGSATKAALSATYVPKWAPNTAYAQGAAVVNPSGDTVTAKVAFTSGASYDAANWNLSVAYDQSMLGVHAVRVADVRRSKGGVIGTNGKGVVAWRIDHQIDAYRSTIWPILRDRGMPAGLGVVTDAVADPTDPLDPTATTWAQLTTAHWEGNEIWAHSATHADPAPYGGLTVEEEILKPRTTLEAQNLHPVGWQMPGVSGVQTPNYSNAFNTAAQFASRPGQLLTGTYGLIEIDRGSQGNRRVLPTNGCYGLGHFTIDTVTLAAAKAQVDLARDYGMGVEIMLHPKYIGMNGYMSVADFTALVDYVKGLWDAGSIEVLTPSGLAFADPGQTRRLNLIRSGGFEGVVPSGTTYGPWLANNATGITVQTDGGQEGSNYARFSGSVNYLNQGYTFVGEGNLGAAAFLFEAYVRNNSAATSIARMQLLDNSGNNPTFARDVKTTLTAGQGWTKVRVPFCIPKTCTNIQARISRFTTGSDGATGDVDFDNIKVQAI